MKSVAIVNPVAGKGESPRKWPELVAALGPKSAHLETWLSEWPGHAEILAARARRRRFDRVVAVGGDGTLHQVVNGLWWEPAGRLPSVGMVPLGTACDYLLNLDTGSSLPEKLATALGELLAPVDVGLVKLRGIDGSPVQRVFTSVMSAGFDARVVRSRRRLASPASGLKSVYAICALLQLIRLKSYRIRGEIDGAPFEAETVLFAVGIGRYYGGGLMITPDAAVNAACFQLVWSDSTCRLELLHLFPKIYSGAHLSDPRAHSLHGHSVKLSADPPAYVQADGELLGTTPIDVGVFPGGLRFAARGVR
jgi:YegS/Rv2252/BmrU family lipid kinase